MTTINNRSQSAGRALMFVSGAGALLALAVVGSLRSWQHAVQGAGRHQVAADVQPAAANDA
jgi:hypothetical protein